MKHISNFLTVVILCTVSLIGFAQQDSILERNKTMGGGGGFTIGYGNYDVQQLHVFVPDQTPDFNNGHILFGGFGYGHIGNFILGGGGNGMFGDQTQTDSLKMSLGGGMGTLNLGYMILNKDKIRIYPLLGFGGGGYGLKISKNKNVSSSTIANDPGHEISISQGWFIFDVSMNLNVIPVLFYNKMTRSYGGFMTGLQLGYTFSMPSNNWSYGGGNVTSGPTMGLNMVYLKLILGGAGFYK